MIRTQPSSPSSSCAPRATTSPSPSTSTTPAHKYEQLLPQLAVVELLISGGSGAELCRRLKESGVPACLAISALEARDEAIAAGADAFLQKPLDPLQFVSTVKDLLGTSAFVQGATSR